MTRELNFNVKYLIQHPFKVKSLILSLNYPACVTVSIYNGALKVQYHGSYGNFSSKFTKFSLKHFVNIQIVAKRKG